MKIKLFLVFVIILVLIGQSNISFADEINFTDSFDSYDYTSNNWLDIEDSWSYDSQSGDSYDGYHGDAADISAASAALNGAAFSNFGLDMEVYFEVFNTSPNNDNGAGLFFSVNYTDSGMIGYSIHINVDENILRFSSRSISESNQSSVHLTSGSLSYDKLYRMTLQTDINTGLIDIFLYDGDNGSSITSLNNIIPSIPVTSGMAGIFTDDEASFYDFSINATPAPVPEPTTMILLGTGLAGLVGFRRKLKKS